ncbi:MAG: putative rane protein [Mycobacterium sp.]|nr:putative rane protein [Mycobacterium sp.]
MSGILGGMTSDPQFGSNPSDGTPPPQSSYPPPPHSGYPPPPGQGYPPPQDFGGQYPPPPADYGQYPPRGGYPGAYPGAYYDPSAPFGRHPVTGEPFSEKSKLVAGLLQLLGLFGLVGVGRMYAGYIGLGITQLIVGLVTCGIGAVIWGIIDAVLILTDRVRDPQGRPLRDGT